MIPVISKIRAKTSEEFGELVHHAGEEFVYVLSGRVTVNTEHYDSVTLDVGQSIYIDSSMGTLIWRPRDATKQPCWRSCRALMRSFSNR